MSKSTASPSAHSRWSPTIGAIYLIATVGFLACVVRFHDPAYGWTRFIHFPADGHEYETAAVRATAHAHEGGYDGAFYAQLAVDPLLRNKDIDRAMDGPGYRSRRILFSWTAYLLGMGEPARVLQAYALQNVLFWLALAALLLRWFPPTGPRPLASWLGVLFGFGMIESVRMALLDGPSLVLIALGVLAIESGRGTLGAGILGVSALGRETNLLAGAALADRPARARDWASLATRATLLILPLALWMDYLRSIYRSTLDASGVANFAMPFAGYVGKVGRTFALLARSPDSLPAWLTALVVVSIAAQVAVLVASRAWRSPWWRVGVGFCVLVVVAGPAIWAGWPGAIARVVLPLSLAANVHLPPNRWFWPAALACNAGAVAGAISLAHL